eukprot:7596660-Alexandrium_andersonii.AAC.1
MVADLLLRRIHAVLGIEGIVLAFADVTAVILRDYKDLQRVARIFEEYAIFSNLKLNLAKTVLVPVFSPGDLETARLALLQTAPTTVHMAIQDHVKYLGILLGPGAGDKGWDAPILKYQ